MAAGSNVPRNDAAVWRAGARQHALVTTKQLHAAGLDDDDIHYRATNSRLHRVYRGVYSLAPPPLTSFAELRGATLAYGLDSLISHRWGTVLWELTEPLDGDDIDVTVVGRRPRQHEGTRLHRVPSLAKADILRRHDIPVTAPARTLVDFAEQAGTAELERALNEARVKRLVSDRALEGAIRRAGRRHGAAKLAALLRQERGPGVTRKEMERIFLGLIRRARLPLPETNAEVLGRERDFYWPEHRLVVETDGWETHSTRAAFEDDRRRDAELTAAGYRVLRFTWRQITEEPEATLAILAAALVPLR